MSELTTRFIDDTYSEYYNTGKHELAQIYLKSEADKVIARRKHKRCLAMARWCDDAARLSTWDSDYHRCGWYNKWMQRWLELAEKFKPNNKE